MKKTWKTRPGLNRQILTSGGTYSYYRAVREGERLLNFYLEGKMPSEDMVEFDIIFDYYSRADVQQAIYAYAEHRKITVMRAFQYFMPFLKQSDDILPLAFFSSDPPFFWPALHGTITRYYEDTCCKDFVLDLDFKQSSWHAAFDAGRIVIQILRDCDVTFFIKFSGNNSPHIIIPAEAFPEDEQRASMMRRKILKFVVNILESPKCLDMSFFKLPDHFLRLPYSMNEFTGLVSIPIAIKEYDDFHPQMADVEETVVMPDFGHIEPHAVERTIKFCEYIDEKGTNFFIDNKTASGL